MLKRKSILGFILLTLFAYGCASIANEFAGNQDRATINSLKVGQTFSKTLFKNERTSVDKVREDVVGTTYKVWDYNPYGGFTYHIVVDTNNKILSITKIQ